ncbi:hypothetical protein [Cupriavidus sp. AcVe19-6a]|uniref:hypothetical protein n=1 Tax=Cupriavidus sp. AcVe19-6a TaxID=2821358 RepID=UPI001AE0FC4E|nr:hypothetical protein [Cupriavidus sp. AcVe19-6a]MBP0638008.1 hypothetical protein [Cupriavidus sp. AcVe19-6a]
MKKQLERAATVLARNRQRAYVSRVAWLDLELMVRKAFGEVQVNEAATQELGMLYLTTNRDYPPFDKSTFDVTNITNQLQISTGFRFMGVSRPSQSQGEAAPISKVVEEVGASLWFNQDATGAVTIFVAPYKSEVMKMSERNFILGRHRWATDISERQVKNYFAKFFRYCATTSVHGNFDASSYLFRLSLRLRDIRFASNESERLWKLAGWTSTTAVALYTGGKLFS